MSPSGKPQLKILVAAALALALLVQVFMRLPPPTMLSMSLVNALHIPMYGFTVIALRAFFGSRPLWQIGAGAFGIGFAAEVAQAFSGRNPSRSDLVLNSIGIVVALAALWLSTTRRRWRVPIWALALLLMAGLVLRRPAEYLLAYSHRDRAFPVLFDSTQDRWEPFLRIYADTAVIADHPWTEFAGESVLRVTWGDRGRLFQIREMAPQDWRRFDTLHVEMYSIPDDPQQLRLAMRQGYQYNRGDWFELVLQPGHNHMRIPLDQLSIALGDGDATTRRMTIRARREDAGETLLIRRIWLE